MGFWTIPRTLVPGSPENANDINTNFTDLRDNILAGHIDANNLDSTVKSEIGVNGDGVVRRGYSLVATAETTTAAGPVNLATDGPKVTLTVPTSGLIYLYGACLITESGSGGTAYVTLVENNVVLGNLLTSNVNGSPVWRYVTPANQNGTLIRFQGGALVFPVAPGAYTYKFQYGQFGGSTNATFANRQLWVEARGYV